MRSKQDSRRELLEVAVAEFAQNGFEKTSVRSIAKAAGASPALLIHYFGTKDQLIREAIITTLGDWVGKEKSALLADDSAKLSDWTKLVRENQTKLQFLRQVLLAKNEYSSSLFEYAVLETKEMLKSASDAGLIEEVADMEALGILLTSNALATLVFLPELEAAFGGKVTDEDVAQRLQKTQAHLLPFKNKQKKVNK
ncbi:MAG: hypothetical protein RLY84_53 [Actinomycetota bacterium]|jgi:AcrR family transcriptional regulator